MMAVEQGTLLSVLSSDNSNLASINVNSQNIIAASTLGLAFPQVRLYQSSFLLSIKLTHQVLNPQSHDTIQRRHNRDNVEREQA